MNIFSETDAVVAGNICLDIIPEFPPGSKTNLKAMFIPGHLTTIGKARFSSGGCVPNTGIALHKLGVRTRFMGKIGDDIFGKILSGILSPGCEDIASGMIIDHKSETSYSIILNVPEVDRIFFHNPGANDSFSSRDVRFDVISRARLFHFGYPPLMRCMYSDGGKELIEIFSSVKNMGVTTSLDMSLPDPSSESGKVNWKKLLKSLLPYVDIFLPSVDEIRYMLDQDIKGASTTPVSAGMLSSISTQLIEMGAKVVGIKLGDQGFYLHTAALSELEKMGKVKPPALKDWAEKELHVPCFKVNVAGTTGAGDTTIAGFLAALLRGLPIDECATMAVAVGACCVEAVDATSGILSWEETRLRVDRGWKILKNDTYTDTYSVKNTERKEWEGEK